MVKSQKTWEECARLPGLFSRCQGRQPGAARTNNIVWLGCIWICFLESAKHLQYRTENQLNHILSVATIKQLFWLDLQASKIDKIHAINEIHHDDVIERKCWEDPARLHECWSPSALRGLLRSPSWEEWANRQAQMFLVYWWLHKHGQSPIAEGSLEVKLLTIRWKSRGVKRHSHRREEQKKEDQKRERVRSQKMQAREKVEKSQNTVFFQWFVAPGGDLWLIRWSADQLIRSPVLFSWPADRDLTAHWGRLSSKQSAASTTFSHCYRPWPLKWEIPTTSRKSVPPLSLRKSRTLDNIRLQASSQAKSMKQEVCSTSDCGRPSWPTLPARLSAQVFCHQDAQEEGGLDGEEMPRQSRQGRCIAWKIWKGWVSTCLVKMDDNRTGASCQLQAAALLNPTSVGSWHHPTRDQCAQAACLSHPPWLALHGALPSSQLLCP